jgi:hypothetical protein
MTSVRHVPDQRALRSKGARSNLSSYRRHISLFHSVCEG